MWSINPKHGPNVGRLTGFSLRYPVGMGNSIIFRIVCREIPVSREICFWETLLVSARRRILVHWVTFLYIDEPPQTILTRAAWLSSYLLPTLGFAVGLTPDSGDLIHSVAHGLCTELRVAHFDV
jgi:hypothetical protein